ncbi:MAG: glycerophosphodiester phosphodiesterase family protein [Desulfosalsimonadaceae bacterium]
MKPVFPQNPLWISHRGYTEKAVENTRESFQAAVDMGFTALETDLRITKDRHIILVHDPTLHRLSGDGRNVVDLTRRELEAFRLRNGEKLLFLDQFLAAFGDCFWTFDVKPEKGDHTILSLAAWAENRGLKQRIVRQTTFLTWRAGHETLIQQIFPGARFYARKPECRRAGFAAFSGLPWLGGIQPGRIYALTPAIGPCPLFKKSIVDRYHRRKAFVIAFLPQTNDQVRMALAAGVDEILINGKITAL